MIQRQPQRFSKELAARIDRIFEAHEGLDDQRKRWPWLTGSLGDPAASIFFVAENPSAKAVEDIDSIATDRTDPNLQWAATRGDRLFREALGRQRLLEGDPMRPTAWHAYITDVMKSPVRVGGYKETPLEAKLETVRLWAPVLRWELEVAKPRFVVAVGNSTRQFIDMLRREQLIPSGYDFRSMTHYAYVGQRAEGHLAPMHPSRVKRYHEEMATIAAAFRAITGPR